MEKSQKKYPNHLRDLSTTPKGYARDDIKKNKGGIIDMFIHTVLWNLQEGKTIEDYKKIEGLLLELKGLIAELKEAKVGYSEVTPNENTRQICLVTYFDNEDDYIVYRDHPEHVRVKEEIGKVFKDRVVADVEVEK